MKLPTPPAKYDPVIEAQRNALLEQADARTLKRVADVEIKTPQRLILFSPDGNRWVITVDNAGVLSATAL